MYNKPNRLKVCLEHPDHLDQCVREAERRGYGCHYGHYMSDRKAEQEALRKKQEVLENRYRRYSHASE